MGSETEETWSREVASYEEVPDDFKGFIEELLAGAGVFPYTVFTPACGEFLDRSNAKLICCFDDRVYVAERRRRAISTTCHLLEDIHYVEMGRVLLRSWIKIISLTGGSPIGSTFMFNTVRWELFTPLVERMRPAAGRPAQVELAAELLKFDYLRLPNYKFMNYARHSIRPGEQVVTTVLQPEIRSEWLSLLSQWLFHVISFAHLSILTDRELIVVRDVEKSKIFDDGTRYGGMWQYIPLEKISTVSLAERKDGRFVLSIALPGGDCIRSLFEASKKEEIEALLSRLGGRFQSGSAGMNAAA